MADGMAVIDVGSGIEGQVRSQEMAEDVDRNPVLPTVGDKVSAKVMRVDPRERRLELSIRRFDRDEERQMLKRYSGRNQEPLTLGDILIDTSAPEEEGKLA